VSRCAHEAYEWKRTTQFSNPDNCFSTASTMLPCKQCTVSDRITDGASATYNPLSAVRHACYAHKCAYTTCVSLSRSRRREHVLHKDAVRGRAATHREAGQVQVARLRRSPVSAIRVHQLRAQAADLQRE